MPQDGALLLINVFVDVCASLQKFSIFIIKKYINCKKLLLRNDAWNNKIKPNEMLNILIGIIKI